MLHKTQCANRCFSKIFETIFLPSLSLRFQVQNFSFRILRFFCFLFSIHCCWKILFIYCVNLIEFSLRHVTGCHSLEFLSAIGNEESVENKIISHFWFCLPTPLKSPWSSDEAHFTRTFGRSWLYVIVIYKYLGHVELFMRSMQFVPVLVWILSFSIWTK